MRRLLGIFIGLFLFGFQEIVLALDVYYSPYKEYSPYEAIPVEKTDTCFVQTERRYRFYEKKELNFDYVSFDTQLEEDEFLKLEDIKVGDWSDWSEQKPLKQKGRTIEEKEMILFSPMKQIRYFHFYDFIGTNGKLQIPELEIFVDEKKLDYTFTCDGCNASFDAIKNGIYQENHSYVKNGGRLTVDLGAFYDLETILIRLFLFDIGTDEKQYRVKVTRDASFDSTSYAEKWFLVPFETPSLASITYDPTEFQEEHLVQPEYEESRFVSEDDCTLGCKRNLIPFYRYQDTFYRKAKWERNYIDGYFVRGEEGWIKDKEQYLDYYRYKTRDKVEFVSNMVVDDQITSLRDLIKQTTVEPIEIKTKLDFSLNGTYQVDYVFPFRTIRKQVTVKRTQNGVVPEKEDSLQDKINRLQSQLDTSKRREQYYQNQEQKIDASNQKVKEQNELVLTLKEQLKKANNQNLELQTKQDDCPILKETTLEKEKMITGWWLLPFFLGGIGYFVLRPKQNELKF